MQVFGLPGHVVRGGRGASRLLDTSCQVERRHDAVGRWRGAVAAGLTGEQAAHAVGVAAFHALPLGESAGAQKPAPAQGAGEWLEPGLARRGREGLPG